MRMKEKNSMREVCRFTFKRPITKDAIEEQMALAIMTAECNFGQAKVRLNAAYVASNDKAVIEVSSAVGEHIAEMFTGLMTKKFGENSFSVERIRSGSEL